MFNLVNNTQQLNTNGIGLGLTVCSEIVKKFGGTINFTSEINIGSTFTFSFKLRGANEEEVLGVQRMNEKKMYFQWNNTTNVDGLKYLFNLNLDRNIHIPRQPSSNQIDSRSLHQSPKAYRYTARGLQLPGDFGATYALSPLPFQRYVLVLNTVYYNTHDSDKHHVQ